MKKTTAQSTWMREGLGAPKRKKRAYIQYVSSLSIGATQPFSIQDRVVQWFLKDSFMKFYSVIFIFWMSLLLGEAWAFMVHDPGHTLETIRNEAKNVARHRATILEWKRNYELLTQQLEEARRLKEVLGDPQAAVKKIATDLLEGNSIDYFWEQETLYWQLKETADSTRALANRDKNLFKEIMKRDDLGNEIVRDLDYYKRHDVIEEQAARVEIVSKGVHDRKNNLRAQRNKALQNLANAKTESEIQAVTAQLVAINGECNAIESLEADEFRKLELQRILNEERKEKERQDALERYVHEEYLANNCIAAELKKIKFNEKI